MLIIGCDYHPGVQQIAFMDTETGEFGERRLEHGEGEAEKFYRDLQQTGISVRVGMEATGHARWFERLLEELHFELWIGDPLEIRATRVRKQKTDRHDAQLLLKLLLEDRFPRIWVASWENRDLRQLLWHRHRLVQMRTRIMNQLQAVALNEGVRQKKRLWGPGRTNSVGVVLIGSVGQPAATRTPGVVRPTEPEYPRVECSCGAGSDQATGSAAAHDASWCGFADGTGLRVDRGDPATICLWQADRELCGIGANGRIQRRSSTARPYQQTGEFSTAVLAGGSGASDGAERPGLAAKVSAPSGTSRTENREGGDGTQAGGPSLLDVAEGVGLRASEEVRFARGTTRKSSGCAVDHRDNDWASRSPQKGEFEEVIMIEVMIEEMVGSN